MGGGINKGFGFNTGGASGDHTVNTNVSNADLTLDGAHTTDVGANTLTFDSGATNIVQVVGSDDTLQVGGANPYKLPTASGLSVGNCIQSSNATTGTAFRQNGFTIPFRMYADGLNSTNWWYPEPMTNNKALALTSDSAIGFESIPLVTTPNVLRRSIAMPGGKGAQIREITFWASCVDVPGITIPGIKVEIWRFSPVNGGSSDLAGTASVSAEIGATGDSNSRLFRATAEAGGAASIIGQYDFIMPVFRLVFEEAPEELDFDVYINGSISLFYTS